MLLLVQPLSSFYLQKRRTYNIFYFLFRFLINLNTGEVGEYYRTRLKFHEIFLYGMKNEKP